MSTQNPQKNIMGQMPQTEQIPQIRQDIKGAELIEEAIRREKKLVYYDEVIMQGFEKEQDSRRIRHISFNQRKHEKMFGEIYQGMTGKRSSCDIKEPSFQKSLNEIIEERIFLGFESIELYRKIYFSVIPVEWKQMMYEIIGDEQNDIIKYLHYLTKFKSQN